MVARIYRDFSVPWARCFGHILISPRKFLPLPLFPLFGSHTIFRGGKTPKIPFLCLVPATKTVWEMGMKSAFSNSGEDLGGSVKSSTCKVKKWDIATRWLGLRMPEIPFLSTSVLEIYRRKMLWWSASQTPFCEIPICPNN